MANRIYGEFFSLFKLKRFPSGLTLKSFIAVIIFSSSILSISAQPGIKSILFTQSVQSVKVEQGKTQSSLEYISASDNAPVSVQLSAVDSSQKIPGWLSVNSKNLNGINYTAGSEITFDFDATNLSIGSYGAKVTASAPGYKSATLKILLSVISGQSGPLADFKVNFQDSATTTPAGWLRDFGQSFGPRSSAYQGNRYVYGWISRLNKTPLDIRKNGRHRKNPPDILLATFMHVQANDIANFKGTPAEGAWEAQVANGNYEVTVSAGDGEDINSRHSINVEGISAIARFVPTANTRFRTASVIVSVSDGFLTVDAKGGTNTKINWIIIKPYTGIRPSVISVNPDNDSKNVNVNTSVSTSVLNLLNSGINNATITRNNVYLTEDSTDVRVPANVNGTGGGDAITLVPASPLKPGISYKFTITSGVKDLSDSSFIPFSSTFTTGTTPSANLTNIRFEKVALPNTTGRGSIPVLLLALTVNYMR